MSPAKPAEMSRSTALLFVAVFTYAFYLECSAQSSRSTMGIIPGVPCTEADVVNMMGKCLLKFTRGHGPAVVTKMRKSVNCDTALVNCTATLETRVCLADLSARELSQPCRPFIDQVADYQFSVFNIPCRVSHLRVACRSLFQQHGLIHFNGAPKIVKECTYPLTGAKCVDLIITDMAEFDVRHKLGLTLKEKADGVTVEAIKAATGCPFKVSTSS